MLRQIPSVFRRECGLVMVLVCLIFVAIPFAAHAVEDDECVACHSLEEAATDVADDSAPNMQECGRIIHLDFGFSCTDCHMDIEELPHSDDLESVDCSLCHEDIVEAFAGSVHERARSEGNTDAPTCIRCHVSQNFLRTKDRESYIHRLQVAHLCGECHSNTAIMSQTGVTTAKQENLYRHSVHGEELASGNTKAPACIECHGYHDTLPLRDPSSRTNFQHVPETCGQCHEQEKEQYLESVHGKSAVGGHKDSPVCTDCHGEHGVLRVDNEGSPVYPLNVSRNTCGRCHGSIVIIDKYNIAGGRVENFFDSYHGLASQHGSKRVANCGSCHGNHLILPSSDPRSTVSPTRLVETCGVCHPGISENVLTAPIHTEVTLRSPTIVAWVPRIYILLIVLVIGGMLAHNGLILWVLLREKFKKEREEANYARFTTFEVIMHVLLTLSFIALAVTGFALKSPEAWWVTLLSYMGMTEESRGLVHRCAGVLMMAVSVLYGFYMVATRRGRSEFVAFMPRWMDVVHVWQNIAFYFGWRAEPPRFDRYDYTEKMEFWALAWGVVIMAVTGLILWFPILSFQYLYKWAIDMAELIHYYEAILATLAIVVWHFFFVMFHPEEYPMSATWLTGRMTRKHLRNRHPLESERLEKEERD